jgi:hypothetical protein
VSECSHFVVLGRKLSSLLASSTQLNSAWRGPTGVFSLRLAFSRLFWITQTHGFVSPAWCQHMEKQPSLVFVDGNLGKKNL